MLQIISPFAPLFCKPCFQAERDDEAWFGQRAEILSDAADGWRKVRMDYGYESYVEAIHLGHEPEAGEAGVIHAHWADVLAAPSYQAPLLFSLPKGSRIRLLAVERGWARLALPGEEEGYTRVVHLAEFPSDPTGVEPAILRGQIADETLSYLGCQYRWGGRTPQGLDCSGLCHAVYLHCGITIYRNSRLNENFPVREIPLVRLQIGDLLYFPGHIAIYLGGGRYIHASGSLGRVVISSLRPSDRDYRADLASCFLCAGSVFSL